MIYSSKECYRGICDYSTSRALVAKLVNKILINKKEINPRTTAQYY